VTDVEAKELLIGGMNYAAYHETDHSLWPADKNTLFGEPHYEVGPRDGQSVWGTGEVFESKMADALRWAIHQLMSGEHYINRIIKRAGVSDV
jgi:hypothetical protein